MIVDQIKRGRPPRVDNSQAPDKAKGSFHDAVLLCNCVFGVAGKVVSLDDNSINFGKIHGMLDTELAAVNAARAE